MNTYLVNDAPRKFFGKGLTRTLFASKPRNDKELFNNAWLFNVLDMYAMYQQL